MRKTNYMASVMNARGKKVAEHRVYAEEEIEPFKRQRREPKEYIRFRNCLWNVDRLIDEGYTIYYQYIPGNFGAFAILDVALSKPFERKRRESA